MSISLARVSRAWQCLVLVLTLSLAGAAVAGQPLRLSSSVETSMEGFLTLSWSKSDALSPAVLELAADNRFKKTIRSVPLNSQIVEKAQVHISGLSDGDYFARLLAEDASPVSDTVVFRVQHRDLGTALSIFAIGAALFITLIAVVIRFAYTEQ